MREVKVSGRVLEVLKINQYESRFQSMSVMVREKETGKVFVGVKGSPEKIHGFSRVKMEGFEGFVKLLSLSGYRSIGFGWKEVNPSEVAGYMVA